MNECSQGSRGSRGLSGLSHAVLVRSRRRRACPAVRDHGFANLSNIAGTLKVYVMVAMHYCKS
jgi:hypothetical protein